MADIQKLYYQFLNTREASDKELSFTLPMIKEKYVHERHEMKSDLENEFFERVIVWTRNRPENSGLRALVLALKNRIDQIKFCRLVDETRVSATNANKQLTMRSKNQPEQRKLVPP